MNHLNDNILLAYVANEIADDVRISTDRHLSECDDCVRRVRALLALRGSFEEVWMSWSADEHARIARQLQLLQALNPATESLSKRAAEWLSAISAGAELAVSVLLHRGERVAGLAASSLPPAFRFEFHPAISGVGSPAEEALLDRMIADSSVALADHQTERALAALREVSHINAIVAQSASSIIYRDNRKYAEIVADGRRGSLMVKHWPGPNPSAEYVLLIPADPTKLPALGVLAAVAGEEYLLAAFADFPDGACDVIIGPSR
ncbi:hypothetical protein HZB60_00240 [candidate division KSB1 bacterium]|nr:hypothetical protein [candidate division KSB1 bacterium]